MKGQVLHRERAHLNVPDWSETYPPYPLTPLTPLPPLPPGYYVINLDECRSWYTLGRYEY